MAFRVDSLADLPAKLREQAAGALFNRQSKRSKYGNVPTEVNGIKFDSQKEANRYKVLLAALQSGSITDLRLQQDFTLQEAYTTPTGKRIRAIRYRADFTYKLGEGYALPMDASTQEVVEWFKTMHKPGVNQLVIEDVKSKGTKTKEYEIKKKLMADKGYIILEV